MLKDDEFVITHDDRFCIINTSVSDVTLKVSYYYILCANIYNATSFDTKEEAEEYVALAGIKNATVCRIKDYIADRIKKADEDSNEIIFNALKTADKETREEVFKRLKERDVLSDSELDAWIKQLNECEGE